MSHAVPVADPAAIACCACMPPRTVGFREHGVGLGVYGVRHKVNLHVSKRSLKGVPRRARPGMLGRKTFFVQPD